MGAALLASLIPVVPVSAASNPIEIISISDSAKGLVEISFDSSIPRNQVSNYSLTAVPDRSYIPLIVNPNWIQEYAKQKTVKKVLARKVSGLITYKFGTISTGMPYTFRICGKKISGNSTCSESFEYPQGARLLDQISRLPSDWGNPKSGSALTKPAFTLSSSSQSVAGNTSISTVTNRTTGGEIASYSISPAVPAGLIFNSRSGELSGAPTTTQSATSYTITATNASGSASATFTLTVTAAVYSLGQTGPGGGIIFYVNNVTGFDCGQSYTATGSPTGGKCNYLEAAVSNWSGGADPSKFWANGAYENANISAIADYTTVQNNNLGVGLGYKNSIAIVNQGNDTSTAAGAARAYTTTNSGTTYSDWYLPTTAELNLMCQWQRGVSQDVTTACTGGTINSGLGASDFISNNYHSSTEYNADVAWMQNFGDGIQAITNKNYGTGSRKVRPIRAF